MSPVDVDNASRQFFARIHRAALVLSGNPWDADDLAQETFLVLAREGSGFAGRSSLYTWLYGILLNLDRRQRRRHGMQRRKLRVLWDNETETPRATPPAEAPLEVAEWKQGLWGRVARLPDGQRQALVLRFSERLSYEEIGEVLECPLGTGSKSRLFHALAALRELLSREENDLAVIPAYPTEDIGHAL